VRINVVVGREAQTVKRAKCPAIANGTEMSCSKLAMEAYGRLAPIRNVLLLHQLARMSEVSSVRTTLSFRAQ
jgi:hypothetical protein